MLPRSGQRLWPHLDAQRHGASRPLGLTTGHRSVACFFGWAKAGHTLTARFLGPEAGEEAIGVVREEIRYFIGSQ